MTRKEFISNAIEELDNYDLVNAWNQYCEDNNDMDSQVFSVDSVNDFFEGLTPLEILEKGRDIDVSKEFFQFGVCSESADDVIDLIDADELAEYLADNGNTTGVDLGLEDDGDWLDCVCNDVIDETGALEEDEREEFIIWLKEKDADELIDADACELLDEFREAEEEFSDYSNMTNTQVKRLNGQYYEVTIPDWTLDYIVNGEHGDLTDEEKEAIDNFLAEWREKGINIDEHCCPMDGAEAHFSDQNDIFGRVGDECYRLVVPMKEEEEAK